MLHGVRVRRLSATFSALEGASARVLRGFSATGSRTGAAVWGALREALSSEEKGRLAVALYDAGDQYRDAPRYAWEDAWIDRWLAGATKAKAARKQLPILGNAIEPPARGTALVGAAGAGREAVALIARGYEVVAIEPSRTLAATCRDRIEGATQGRSSQSGSRSRVIEARYEDLDPVEIEGMDAVLLGLGSLSHVLDDGARDRLFAMLVRACPHGPILASTLAPPAGVSVEEARREGRSAKVGRAVGAALRSWRGLPDVDPAEIVFDTLGFAKLFTRDELAALGDRHGRRTIFEDAAPDGMHLCAFVPR